MKTNMAAEGKTVKITLCVCDRVHRTRTTVTTREDCLGKLRKYCSKGFTRLDANVLIKPLSPGLVL